MNVINAVRNYVGKIIGETSGMKMLLLDEETTGIISMVYTQSEILEKEVYLVDRIETLNREKITHLKAVCFVRPTAENISRLCKELKDPKYGQYYLYFSNVLSDSDLENLADADEHEVVREVQELFGDIYAVNDDTFTLNQFEVSLNGIWNQHAYNRTLEGLKALLLSLKKRPYVRYQCSSSLCKRLALAIETDIEKEPNLFDFRRPDVSPMLLIIDRRDDPITPLLNQWTYQAMVHEWLGIHNQRVNLKNVPNVPEDLSEIVLSSETDDFFKSSMFLNFGDICMKLKEMVDEYKKKTKSTKDIETVSDMRDFIDNYPQFRQLSGTISKHVTLVGELSRLVNLNLKLEVSETEQDIACEGEHADILNRMKVLLDSPKIDILDKVRLVLLYILRFERRSNNMSVDLINILRSKGISNNHLACMDAILKYGGHDVRDSDLFGNKSFLAFTQKTFKGLKGIQNVYTQHEPLLEDILDSLMKSKLSGLKYPYASTAIKGRLKDVIIFMVGGITYNEACVVSEFNKKSPGIRVVLGGTCIHNCESFLKEVLVDSGHSD